MKNFIVRMTIVAGLTLIIGLAVVVANPACVENDSAVAATVYDNCLKNTYLSQQCRRTANDVSCKRWGFWLWRS